MYWVDLKLAPKKGFKFYQTRSNAIILYETLPAYCIPKRDHLRESIASPRLPPKISFKDNWMKELGSEVAGGNADSQQIQPKIKNPIVSTVRPVKSEQPSGSLSQEIDKGVLFGCESTNERTERLVNSCVPVSVECLDNDRRRRKRRRRSNKNGETC